MRIYVGNIAQGVSEEDLRKTFRAFGEVSFVNIVADRFNKAAARFGIVGMPDAAEGGSAIAALDKTKMKGQAISVAEAVARINPPATAG